MAPGEVGKGIFRESTGGKGTWEGGTYGVSLNSNGGLAMQGIEQQSELESVSSFPATPVSVSVTTKLCVLVGGAQMYK